MYIFVIGKKKSILHEFIGQRKPILLCSYLAYASYSYKEGCMLVFMTNFKAFWLIFNLITKTTRDEFKIALKTVGGISPL